MNNFAEVGEYFKRLSKGSVWVLAGYGDDRQVTRAQFRDIVSDQSRLERILNGGR